MIFILIHDKRLISIGVGLFTTIKAGIVEAKISLCVDRVLPSPLLLDKD